MSSQRFRTARWSALGVGVVAIALVAVLATRPPATMVMADSPLVGRAAPPIVAESFAGSTISLSSMRGRWVLVNFFASWCDACRQEEPQLEQFLYAHPGGARTDVLGVLFGDTEGDGKAFQAAEGATWPSVVDNGGSIASDYGVGSLPRSYLVSPTGQVVASIEGAVTSTDLVRWIEQEQARGL
ncbi:MAG: redoxin domain-containing protein [Acidimicrobiales bacterium]|jgi:cytochrome c biogenesis protein CcmG, thiol:disulfide interchange protein DsbE